MLKTTTDASDLHTVLLQSGIPQTNLGVLLDGAATKAAISANLDWLARHAKLEDTVLVFFSGHGVQLMGGFWPGEYLCPVEADLNQVTDSLISNKEFTAALNAIPAGRLVVLLDACHAGGVGETKDVTTQVKIGFSETVYDQLSRGQGRVIIAACRPDEVSYELPDMSNGLFTHYLLAGLRGDAARQDGTVWISNLFGYVYEKVSQHKLQHLQHPFQKSAAEDFVIVVTNMNMTANAQTVD